jgi:uncharacterized CHY-type Zn-finger protein
VNIRDAHSVLGVNVDPHTRCEHYHSTLDIIAIKMMCCGAYYACKDCHEALANHPIQVWPSDMQHHKAVLCGSCGTELTIAQYMAAMDHCPTCNAKFNPGCRNHHHFYFAENSMNIAGEI